MKLIDKLRKIKDEVEGILAIGILLAIVVFVVCLVTGNTGTPVFTLSWKAALIGSLVSIMLTPIQFAKSVQKGYKKSEEKRQRKLRKRRQRVAYSCAASYDSVAGDNGEAARRAAEERREADQRVWERTQALNEAAFHQYYANQNRGNNDGYWHQNMANNARNRAR